MTIIDYLFIAGSVVLIIIGLLGMFVPAFGRKLYPLMPGCGVLMVIVITVFIVIAFGSRSRR